jgi:hypothetical protein
MHCGRPSASKLVWVSAKAALCLAEPKTSAARQAAEWMPPRYCTVIVIVTVPRGAHSA